MVFNAFAARWWWNRFSSMLGESQIFRKRVAKRLKERPLRILIDLARIGPSGLNGGIKVFTLGILRCLKSIEPAAVTLLWIVQENLIEEALVFADDSDEIWVLAPEKPEKTKDPRVRFTAETGPALATTTRADVLYAPVGVTDLHSAAIPTIGIAVDVLHRDYPDTLPPAEVAVREAWFERMMRDYRFVQCISEWTAGRVQHHYPHCRASLFVTHCAMPAPDRPKGQAISADKLCFLYPANSWTHKNHSTLLLGYRQYLRRRGNARWKLVLSGHRDPPMERILAHARVLGLQKHVEHVGHLPPAGYGHLWTRVGAMVFPSLHEGFGIPILEAMRLEVPVIAGRIGSIPEVAGDACFYADMRIPSEIAAALDRLQDDRDLRDSLRAAGRQRAALFSLETQARKLLSVFRKATAGCDEVSPTLPLPPR